MGRKWQHSDYQKRIKKNVLEIAVLSKIYSIYRFPSGKVIPQWIYSSDFYSITKTRDELSLIAEHTDLIPKDILVNTDWRILKVKGPLDFSLIGIIADISAVFKENKISIFVISTYDTDYILLKEKDLNKGTKALTEMGYSITQE
jgi:hypothetical protein